MTVSSSWAVRQRAVGLSCLLTLSSSALASARAFAQTPPIEESAPQVGTRARVDQLLSHGIQSRDAGHDSEALEFFRQAAALDAENPRVLAHLGATYHALGRWVSAHRHLVQALQYQQDMYIQRHRAELEEALATVADHIGFLEVYGAPPGAEALLNGQVVAALPMQAPAPVIVGSYLLEVRLAHHYTLGRPITIAKRVLTREEVQLAPHREGAAPAAIARADAAAGEAGVMEDAASRTNWWPWALGGLSVAAAATSVVAWERREHYAERWNDDEACIGVGVSRQERCGAELDRGQRAEAVLWVSAAAAGLFAGGAVLSALLWQEDDGSESGAARCVPGLGGAACFGSF